MAAGNKAALALALEGNILLSLSSAHICTPLLCLSFRLYAASSCHFRSLLALELVHGSPNSLNIYRCQQVVLEKPTIVFEKN